MYVIQGERVKMLIFSFYKTENGIKTIGFEKYIHFSTNTRNELKFIGCS